MKIVEEPPKSALIIFTAKDPSVLSPALRSRLHKLYIPQQNPKPGITPHESEKEKPLRVEIEEKIITLYNQDKIKHTPKISFLLKKLESATRFNLNPKIQRKSVDRILSDL